MSFLHLRVGRRSVMCMCFMKLLAVGCLCVSMCECDVKLPVSVWDCCSNIAPISVIISLGVKFESGVLQELVEGADGHGRGMLLFPEICTMELQLLASGSPDLEVLRHVFHSLLDAVKSNHRNAALLYDQVGQSTISSFFWLLLSIQVADVAITKAFTLALSKCTEAIFAGAH